MRYTYRPICRQRICLTPPPWSRSWFYCFWFLSCLNSSGQWSNDRTTVYIYICNGQHRRYPLVNRGNNWISMYGPVFCVVLNYLIGQHYFIFSLTKILPFVTPLSKYTCVYLWLADLYSFAASINSYKNNYLMNTKKN